MATTYIVKKGDTLSEIAQAKASEIKDANGNTISDLWKRTDYLQTINGIKNRNLIYIGQKLILTSKTGTAKKNTSNKAIITDFGVQTGTGNTLFAAWRWDKSNTENYEVRWTYDTGDGVWFVGSSSTTTDKQSTYSIPNNAKKVRFKVKPVSKTKTVNNKEVKYWTAEWSSTLTHYTKDNPLDVPEAPGIDINNLRVTLSIEKPDEQLDKDAKYVRFRLIRQDTGTVYTKSDIKISNWNKKISQTFDVTAGYSYYGECRVSKSSTDYSAWSAGSSVVSTIPAAPKSITKLYGYSDTQIYIEWSRVVTAESYEVQYTTKKDYFDTASSEVHSVTSPQSSGQTKMILSVDTGDEYFFRVRAVNDAGNSSWTPIKSCTIGKKPAAPTTWSSTSTAMVGEPVNLYWMHNSIDGSTKQWSELEITVNDKTLSYTIDHREDEEDEQNNPGTFAFDTSSYTEGIKMEWKVKTAGVFVDAYGNRVYSDWSVTRKVDIWAPPTLAISMTDSTDSVVDTLTTFPFYISGDAGPITQKPICYHVNITANEGYETVDDVGNKQVVSVGDSVYSKLFDTNNQLIIELSAHNINLENNISYTVTVEVTMNSGLSAQASLEFTVAWEDKEYTPNAEIFIDYDNLSASIRPFCEDENGELLDDIILSVYRREFDGTFTEIGSDISNSSYTFITDPHPALDYARYRIVAKTESTGAVSYYDLPGYPVGEKAVIIQWDEEWRSFDVTSDDTAAEEQEQPTWTGSLLKLPYNVDVSDSYSPDVAHVKYIGRRHPVSYYGTQIGSTSSWSVEIDKQDTETLYALRRLAIWMGNVYVREPSGSGYWANINVSFSQTHCELTIPISIDVTRVEGGI